jgi:fibronectin type 3 domain-containing protein
MPSSALLALALILSFTGCREPYKYDTQSPDLSSFEFPPDTPREVTASGNSASSAVISWKTVSSAEGYNIYRESSSRDSFAKISTTAATTYTDIGLSADTLYCYKVSAFNTGGESSLSSAVYALTYSEAPTTAPSGVTASAQSSSSIRVNWSTTTGSSQYIVYRSLTESGDYTEISRNSATSYTDTGLTAETTYYYKVAANNTSGTSPLSAAVSATTLDLKPRAPSSVSADGVSYSSIIINWSSGSNATGYRVYRSPSYSGSYSYIGQSSSTSYRDSGLSAGTLYYYKVSGTNTQGESDLSTASALATTLASGAGKDMANAITLSSYGSGSKKGDFPDDMIAVWYKLTSYGAGKLYAHDKTDFGTSYTGDIVVDVMYSDGSYAVIGSKLLMEINIGGGINDPNNITASNWNGTFYVRVSPRLLGLSQRGTFELCFTTNIY